MKNEVKKNVSEIHIFIFIIQTAGLEMDIKRKKKNVSEIDLFTFLIQTAGLEMDISRKKYWFELG